MMRLYSLLAWGTALISSVNATPPAVTTQIHWPPWCPDQCRNPRPCNGKLIDVDIGLGSVLEIGAEIGSHEWCCDDEGGGGTVTVTATIPHTTTVTESDIVTVTECITVTTTVTEEETVTVPRTQTVTHGETVSVPHTVTITHGETVSVPHTVTVTDEETVSVPHTLTITDEETRTQHVTLPGETETRHVTDIITLPPSTTTVTTTLPPSTVTMSGTTITLPPETITTTTTLPGETITVTRTSSEVETVTQSSIVLCPTRTANPHYAPRTPLPSNYLWGCPPGTLCQPNKKLSNSRTPEHEECNFERGPPSDDYVCHPDQCLPTPPLREPQYWGEPVYGNETGKYVVSPGYFNMNPRKFGLDYDVFVTEDMKPSPHHLSRRQSDLYPSECFEDCNNCLVWAENAGLSEEDLCPADSKFRSLLGECESCIEYHGGEPGPIEEKIPDFAKYLNFCDTFPEEPTSTTPAPGHTATTTSEESTSTTEKPTTTPPETSDPPETTSTPPETSAPPETTSNSDGSSTTPPESSEPPSTTSDEPSPTSTEGDVSTLPTSTGSSTSSDTVSIPPSSTGAGTRSSIESQSQTQVPTQTQSQSHSQSAPSESESGSESKPESLTQTASQSESQSGDGPGSATRSSSSGPPSATESESGGGGGGGGGDDSDDPSEDTSGGIPGSTGTGSWTHSAWPTPTGPPDYDPGTNAGNPLRPSGLGGVFTAAAGVALFMVFA